MAKTIKVHLMDILIFTLFQRWWEWPRKNLFTGQMECCSFTRNEWKILIYGRCQGMNVWVMPFTELKNPMITASIMDPFERAYDGKLVVTILLNRHYVY
jgi:hypothetical protein